MAPQCPSFAAKELAMRIACSALRVLSIRGMRTSCLFWVACYDFAAILRPLEPECDEIGHRGHL